MRFFAVISEHPDAPLFYDIRDYIMRTQGSESFIVLPLLPIFLVGVPPILLFSLLGFPGLVILGVLLICVGLTERLEANSDFNQQIIVHGYARQSERTLQASNLHSAIRFSALIDVAGAGLIAAGLLGFFYLG
jgi:hypothetical protein